MFSSRFPSLLSRATTHLLRVQRQPRRCHSGVARVTKVKHLFNSLSVLDFKEASGNLARPLLVGVDDAAVSAVANGLPAVQRWFRRIDEGLDAGDVVCEINYPYMEDGDESGGKSPKLQGRYSHVYPYEITWPQLDSEGNDILQRFIQFVRNSSLQDSPDAALLSSALDDLSSSSSSPKGRFGQIHAPLSLLHHAQRFNLFQKQQQQQQQQGGGHPVSLYVAQMPLTDLPTHLGADVPTPRLVLDAGRGDVYGAAAWLGLEPTSTPLHRDPNHNLFVQLVGTKVVRLLPPVVGRRVFNEVRCRLAYYHAYGAAGGGGGPNLRGPEMMAGPERHLFESVVWGGGEGGEGHGKAMGSAATTAGRVEVPESKPPPDLVEAVVGPGDALFVPMGWWHAVRSRGSDGCLNASVNWWFR